MYTLSEDEFHREAEPALRQVFVSDEPFDEPFSPNVTARRIVYPCFEYIEPPLIDAIVAAAINVGDPGCYLYNLWTGKEDLRHCYIPFSEFSAAYLGTGDINDLIGHKLGMIPDSENILYSPTGKWGIIVSHEHHGMLGGVVEFIEDIHRSIPDLDEQVYNFIEERLRNHDTGTFNTVVLRWLPGLLAHVYGQIKAEEILQKIGVKRRYWKK
jgi:hypothetical protein